MRLKIEKFAKISEAEIQLDGITVIAGLNDTGKSTIGKVLYSMFNSLYAIDKSVYYKRRNDINEICSEIVNGIFDQPDVYRIDDENNYISTVDSLSKKILEYDAELTEQIYREMLIKELIDDDMDKTDIDDYVESSFVKISAIKNTLERDLYREVLDRYFSKVFSTQMNNCYFLDEEAVITLTLKSKDIRVVFKDNQCKEMEMPTKIMHEAFFIDDPFVLDNADPRRYRNGYGIRGELVRRIVFSRRDIMDGIFDAVTSKENLKEINEIFSKVVNGEIRNSRDGMKYIPNGHEEQIAVPNLSAGLKGFILVRTLLERGVLKEKDVLILDEPEVHMHTQWQLIYAEIIVLLQRDFDLTILVTTHSSHFLQAIEFFSKKYKVQKNCNYYLSKMDEGGISFENVTHDTNKIHSEMVEPSILLDRLEEELEYENEE